MEISYKESAGILNRTSSFLQIDATVKGYHDSHDHADKRLQWKKLSRKGVVYAVKTSDKLSKLE